MLPLEVCADAEAQIRKRQSKPVRTPRMVRPLIAFLPVTSHPEVADTPKRGHAEEGQTLLLPQWSVNGQMNLR
jgi:hypothetical protein